MNYKRHPDVIVTDVKVITPDTDTEFGSLTHHELHLRWKNGNFLCNVNFSLGWKDSEVLGPVRCRKCKQVESSFIMEENIK